MSKQIQLRRGTTAEHASFAGAVGEVTVDTTKDTLVVHDGALNGGYPLAKASDLTDFITLNDLSSTTGITYNSGVIGADTAVLATKAYVDSSIVSAVAAKDNTDEISEGTNNLYFTTARARSSVSTVDNGGDGSLTYNAATGVFSYTGPSASDVRAHFSASTGISITDGAISVDSSIANKTYVDTNIATALATKDNSDEITEGTTNLYFTNARARSSISVTDNNGDGSLAYNSTTGVLTYTGPSASEVRAHFSAGSGITINSGVVAVDSTIANKTYVDNSIISAVAGKDNTDEITEGSTNLYFTNTRARGAISLTDVGGDGSLVYNSTTGVFTYTGPSASEVRAHFSGGTGVTITDGVVSIPQSVSTTANVTFNSISATTSISAPSITGSVTGTVSSISNHSTDSLSEGTTNLYYTNARARSAISVTDAGGDGSLSYNGTTGVLTYTGPSSTEVRAHFSAGTGISITNGVVASTITQYTDALARASISYTAGAAGYNNTTGVISIPNNTNQLTNGAGFITSSDNITGSAAKWTTARTITLGGDLSGSVSIDGSANATLTATIAANSVALGTDTTGNYVAGVTAGTGVTVSGTAGEGWSPTVSIGQAVGPTDSVTFAGVTVNGNLTVSGTTTTVSAQNLAVSDNMIYMNQAIQTTITNVVGNGTSVVYTTSATHNYTVGMSVSITDVNPTAYNLSNQTITAITSNTFTVSNSATGTYVSGGTARAKSNVNPDLGWAAGYNDGTYRHCGMFRDASDNRFKVFVSYTPEPDASAFIDTTHASFTLADLQAANFIGNLTGNVTGAVTGNASTATTLQTARTISLSGDASGSVSFNGSANADISVTVADNSHNHTIANITDLQTTLNSKATKGAISTTTTSGGAYTLDVADSAAFDTFVVTLQANTSIFMGGPPNYHNTFTLVTKQDATGGRTITWPASFKFNGGIAPPQTTTANAVDVWSIFTYDGGTTYIVSLAVKDAK